MNASTRPLHLWLIAIALGLLAALPYLQTRSFEFLNFDDNHYVTENYMVTAGLTWKGIAWAFTTMYFANWHPLTWLSHMLDVQLWSNWAGGHHLTNVIVHAINTMLLFWLLRRMTGSIWRSVLVAIIFAWHPLHVESVAWISERKDVLSTCFGFLAIGAYVGYVRQPTALRYLLIVVAFAMSLMCKAMFVTLPCMLLLFDIWPLRRWRLWTFTGDEELPLKSAQTSSHYRILGEKVPLLVMSIVSSVMTLIAQAESGTVATLEDMSVIERLETSVLAYQSYLLNTIYPAELSFFYTMPKAVGGLGVLIAGSVLIGLTVMAYFVRRRQPWVLIGWLFFIGTLVPVIGLVRVGMQFKADRYMYVPLIGLALAIAWMLPAAKTIMVRVVTAMACVAVSVFMLAGTWVQVGYWKNNLIMNERALALNDQNYMAYLNLGSHYEAAGDIKRAIDLNERALLIKPLYGPARERMANAMIQQGQFERALEQLEYAHENSPIAHNSYGIIMLAQRRYDEAESAFRRTLALQQDHMEARGNLGALLVQKQQWSEAAQFLTAVLDAFPERHGVRLNYARSLSGMGKREQAIGEVRRVLDLVPDHARARQLLAELTAAGSPAGPGQ